MRQYLKTEEGDRPPFSGLSGYLTNSQDGYLLCDSTLRVVDVNPQYFSFHHLFNSNTPRLQSNIDKSTFENFSSDFKTRLSAVISGNVESNTLQLHNLSQPSVIYQVQIKAMVVDDKNTKGIGVFVHTMKASNLPQSHCPESQLFEVLVQNSTDVYQLADAGFIITYTSNAAQGMLGHPPHYFIGRSVFESIHPDDRDKVQDWLISIRSISENCS